MLQLLLHWLPAKSSVGKAGTTWESIPAGSKASKISQSFSHLAVDCQTKDWHRRIWSSGAHCPVGKLTSSTKLSCWINSVTERSVDGLSQVCKMTGKDPKEYLSLKCSRNATFQPLLITVT